MDANSGTAALYELMRSPACVRAMQLTGLVAARLLPLFLLTPIFGGQGVPSRLRFGIALAVAVAMVGSLYDPDRPVLAPPHMTTLLGKELLLGLILAVLLLVLFHGFAAFGSLVDQARGEGALSVHDPHTQHQQTATAVFALHLACTLFLTFGGARALLYAVGSSYVCVPVDALLPARLTPAAALPALLGAAGDMFGVALCLAAPVMLVTLLVDVILAQIARVARPMDLSVLGLSMKGSLAVCLVLLTLAAIFARFRGEAEATLNRLAGLVAGT